MEEQLKFRIKYDSALGDNMKIERRGVHDYVLKVGRELDLVNDKQAIEEFENQFNYAYHGTDFNADPILRSKEIRRQKVELERLQEALNGGEERHNFRVYSH